MDFEDVLFKVGFFGKYQKKLILLFLIPSSIIFPWFVANIFFMVSTPDHWCTVPELASSDLSIAEQQKLIRPPKDPKCSMYDINYTSILVSQDWTIPEDAETKQCDNGWEYDKKHFTSTIATKWNLVCKDGYYASVALSTAEIGGILGTPIYGALSDKLGRKPIFFLTVLITFVASIAAILQQNFTIFLVFRTIDGTIMPSIFQLPYVILLELVGPHMRTLMNGIMNCSWTLGLCILPIFAWLASDWKTLGLITSSSAALYLLFLKILPESPRWLVCKGKYEKAADILMKIGKENNKPVDRDDLIRDLKEVGEKVEKEKERTKMTLWKVFTYPQLRKKFVIISYCWTAEFASYYGLQLNVPNLEGNEFLNFFILAICELPGYLCSWYFMDKVGRRWWSVVTLIFTGLACMLPVILPEEYAATAVVSSAIAKFSCSAAFMAVYQQSAELYPTVIRSFSMGLSSTVSSVLNLSTPYIVYLSRYGKYIPFLVISLVCITAGISSSFLPETLNEVLPQTIEESEKFGRNHKYFSWNRRRRPSCYDKQNEDMGKAKANIAEMKNGEEGISKVDTTIEMKNFEGKGEEV